MAVGIMMIVGIVAAPIAINAAIVAAEKIGDAVYVAKINAHKKGWI